MKIIIDKKGNRNFWTAGDFHSLFGILKEEELKNRNGILKSHIGKEFIVFEAGFADKFDKLKRGPAAMCKKDIGLVIAYTGINPESKIVEAGAGCGFMTAYLGRISKDVYSYENNPEFYEISRKNLEFLGVKANLKLKDIYSGIDEKNADVVFLDLLEPWKVLEHAANALKSGGYFVCYVTNITQAQEIFRQNSKLENKFVIEKIIECIEREWIADEIKARPKSQMLGHTGFLVFMRKV